MCTNLSVWTEMGIGAFQWDIFIKTHIRQKDGKRHTYYSIAESVRVGRAANLALGIETSGNSCHGRISRLLPLGLSQTNAFRESLRAYALAGAATHAEDFTGGSVVQVKGWRHYLS